MSGFGENNERLSAHLDGELSDDETEHVLEALRGSDSLADDLADLARVRSRLRESSVVVPDGAFERMMAGIDHKAEPRAVAPVVTLASRRRVPTFAAVAAALVIIASVVGGIGGTETLPALGDLVSQHQAAAAMVDGAEMPEELAELDDMPMDAAMGVGPPMPADVSMQHAFVDGPMVHLVYLTGGGEPLSVFRHEGETDIRALGIGTSITQNDMWSGERGDSHVVVVDGSGYVWVVVSSEPHDEMMDSMMDDLPSRSPGLGERLREAADAAVAPFRIGN